MALFTVSANVIPLASIINSAPNWWNFLRSCDAGKLLHGSEIFAPFWEEMVWGVILSGVEVSADSIIPREMNHFRARCS